MNDQTVRVLRATNARPKSRFLIIGGGGNLGIKSIQPALRELGLGSVTECLEIRPPRPGEVAQAATTETARPRPQLQMNGLAVFEPSTRNGAIARSSS